MARQKETVEFRYYMIPKDEVVLALQGEDWIREYGKDIKYLHFHNLMEIGYCHWGMGDVIIGQEKIPFSEQSIMIVPPRLPHTTNSHVGTKAYWTWMYVDLEKIFASLHWYDPMFQGNILKRIHRTGYLLSGDQYPVLTQLILGVMNEVRYKKLYYNESIRGLLRACLVEFLRLSDQEERIMRGRLNTAVIAGALDYVTAHYNQEIRVLNLAEACNMSESHFRRVFEKAMNMKPVDYINLIRIQRACELLKKTDKTMEEVAGIAGFSSISTFNRNFRKILNISPYQWKTSADNYESRLFQCRISPQKGW